jgi:hypothetical protein
VCAVNDVTFKGSLYGSFYNNIRIPFSKSAQRYLSSLSPPLYLSPSRFLPQAYG